MWLFLYSYEKKQVEVAELNKGINSLVKRLGITAVVLVSLISIVFLFPLQSLKFDFNLEQFFPTNDPDLQFFQEHVNRFNSDIDDEYIFIGLTNEAGVFDEQFLRKVDTLTKFIFEMDSIIAVYSITNSYHHVVRNKRFIKTPVVHFLHPDRFTQDSIKLYQSGDLRDLLISKDGRSISISAFNSPNTDNEAQRKMLELIRNRIDELSFHESYLTAKILVEETYLKEIKKNLRLYLSLSFILISLILLVLFRTLIGVIIPLLAIAFSLIWTLGLMALFDYPIDIISSLLPPVLAVICMSDVIHISTKYIEQLQKGVEKIEALKNTFKTIGLATFFTSITTAIGFFALAISTIVPIRSFGVFAGIGVMLAFIIVVAFVFGFYVTSSIPQVAANKALNKGWNRFLSAGFIYVLSHRLWIIGTTSLLIVLSGYFISTVKINSSLLAEIPQESGILDDYEFLETQFAGTRPFELALEITDSTSTFLDIANIKAIDEISTYLTDSCGVGMLVSHASFIKSARQAFVNGKPSEYKVPDQEGDIYFMANRVMETEWASQFMRYMTMDRLHVRVSGRLPDLTTVEFNALAEKFDKYFHSGTPKPFSYKLTGSGVLMDKTTFSLPRNMITGVLIVFFIIALIVGGMFRSFSMVAIVLVANIVPLILMAAMMGALGIYLKADTSIIFAISFGIIVDDSIHYLTRVKLELGRGKSLLYALKRAYISTGKAMIITTILLLAGFIPLIFSSFGGTFYIGLLISACLLLALIVDLTLLPALIFLFFKKKAGTSSVS